MSDRIAKEDFVADALTPPVTLTGAVSTDVVLTIQPASPATLNGEPALTIKDDAGADALILDADGSFHSISPFVGQEQPYIVDRQGFIVVQSYDNTNAGTFVLKLGHEGLTLVQVRTVGHGEVLTVQSGDAADVPIRAYGSFGAGGAQTAALQEWYDTNGDVVASVTATGGIVFPSADPHVVGAWWDNAGTLTRSAG